MAVSTRSTRSKAPQKGNPKGRYVNVLLQANVYEALQKYALDHGFTEPAVMRIAAAMLLKNGGYLQTDYPGNQKTKK